MSERYSHIVRAICAHPWAMLQSTFDAMLEVVELRLDGVRLTDEEVQARITAADRSSVRPASAPGSIAVLPLAGVIAQRMDLFTAISGGTSTERFGADLAHAVADPNVAAVVIDVHSPGGSVYGVEELSDRIHSLRGSKPIVAVANSMAASAAYWIASQADELYVTPSGDVGSVGVIAAHIDVSAATEKRGERRTFVTAGRFKAEGNPYEPLGEDARAALQERVDAYYGKFVSALARGRGVSEDAVRAGFGEGRLVMAAQAVDRGMADGVRTLQEVINDLAGRQGRSGGRARAGLRAMETGPGDEAAAARAKARLRLARGSAQ